jgi:hypothetical protein
MNTNSVIESTDAQTTPVREYGLLDPVGTTDRPKRYKDARAGNRYSASDVD